MIIKSRSHFIYPMKSFCVSRALMSLRASLGRQKLLMSSSRKARAPLSTRDKLSLSRKGRRGPRKSRVGPSISPTLWEEEPCKAAYPDTINTLLKSKWPSEMASHVPKLIFHADPKKISLFYLFLFLLER